MKKALLGVRSPCQEWTWKHFCIFNLELSSILFDTFDLGTTNKVHIFREGHKTMMKLQTFFDATLFCFLRFHQILVSFSEHLNFMYLSKPFYRWVPNDVFLFDRNAFRSTIVSMLYERKIMQIEFLIKVKSFAVHTHTALFHQICFTGK